MSPRWMALAAALAVAWAPDDGPYKPEWESLKRHKDPEWFHDAKLGIYTHWGPVTVATEDAPGAMEWYGRQMYEPKHRAFQYHREKFGDQKTVGYKDVIPRFKAEKFNAEEWADLFARAGARFAGPVAIHHDNYALWDSAHTRWDSVKVGPGRDFTGELAKAIRARDMKFIATFHHAFAWGYYEPAYAYDAADPQYADLYGEPHKKGDPPTGKYLETWLAMVNEVAGKYEPDLIWFDFGLGRLIPPEYQRRMFADYYNWAAKKGKDVGVAHKHRDIHQHTGILDFERGREDRLTPYPWLTDTSVGPWFHHNALGFKTADNLVDIFADIVSKNGCMLLNVGPAADGTIPEKGRDLLLALGAWLKVNGEAIYGTRPWEIYGEGPTRLKGGAFSEKADQPYTARDIRYTRSKDGKTLFAIVLGRPEGDLTLQSVLSEAGPEAKAELLGGGEVNFRLNEAKQPILAVPAGLPDAPAFAFKLTGFQAALQPRAAAAALAEQPDPGAPPEALERWRQRRFGMFIHWGPVSLKGTEIGWSRGAQVPQEEYDNLYRQFNPTLFNADEWVKAAKDAGMKYMVITSKHHDGFCIWPTKETEYNIGNSPFKRDVLKELSEACRKQGIAFGTYYSVCDWHHPAFPRGSPGGKTKKPDPDLDAYTEYLKKQVTELITNYGPLSTMWFDVPQEFNAERGRPVVAMVRSLQPDIIVNNRCAIPADYDTPEQRVGGFNRNRPWETCMTICRQWAWKPDDRMKSLQQCIQTLLQAVGGDGNFLFNVGPMPDGRIESRQVERLKEMGSWLAKYGDGVYGTRGGPFRPGRWGASTCKEDRIFLYVMNWPEEGPLQLPPVDARVTSHRTLSGGKAAVEQTAEGIAVSLPPGDRDEIASVIELTVEGKAFDIPPAVVGFGGGSLAAGRPAKASNVFQNQAGHAADKAVDDDTHTRWATDAGTHQAWLEVDLGKPVPLGSVAIRECVDFGQRVKRFELQAEENGAWKTILEGTTIGEDYEKRLDPVTTRRVRLNILEASEGPTIWEFQLFGPKGGK